MVELIKIDTSDKLWNIWKRIFFLIFSLIFIKVRVYREIFSVFIDCRQAIFLGWFKIAFARGDREKVHASF